MSNSSTAILIFAQSASLDARIKGLKGGESLLKELTRRTLSMAYRTGYPCFHYDEHTQSGDTFGERLGNAMQALFDKGVKHLIVIGNDSPDLKTETLLQAADQLHAGKTVLGPSTDGGTYLIGINKPHFHWDSFVGLPWQNPELLEELTCWNISTGGALVFLNDLLDLDTPSDCRTWLGTPHSISNGLKRLLLGFVACLPVRDSAKHFQNFGISLAIPFNKGSPI